MCAKVLTKALVEVPGVKVQEAIKAVKLESQQVTVDLDTTKSDAKPPLADSKEISQRLDSVRPVNPDEITPGNARQAVNALWQELDHAEEP